MESHQNELFAGVDTAALALAAVATVTSVGMTEGDWTWFTTFLGVTLTAMILALHRWSPPRLTFRSVLLALAFGLVLTLCLTLVLARPLQPNFGNIMEDKWMPWWLGTALLFAIAELGFSRCLAKDTGGGQKRAATHPEAHR